MGIFQRLFAPQEAGVPFRFQIEDVFGVKGRKLAQPDQKGLATAGFVLGIIGTVIGALGIICVVCAVGIFSAAGTAGMLS